LPSVLGRDTLFITRTGVHYARRFPHGPGARLPRPRHAALSFEACDGGARRIAETRRIAGPGFGTAVGSLSTGTTGAYQSGRGLGKSSRCTRPPEHTCAITMPSHPGPYDGHHISAGFGGHQHHP